MELDDANVALRNMVKDNLSPELIEEAIKKVTKLELKVEEEKNAIDKTEIINFGEGEWRLRYYEEKF